MYHFLLAVQTYPLLPDQALRPQPARFDNATDHAIDSQQTEDHGISFLGTRTSFGIQVLQYVVTHAWNEKTNCKCYSVESLSFIDGQELEA